MYMSWVDASDLLIGPIDFATANTVSYTLPDLPDNVDQVLIFIWGYSGAATGSFSRLFDIWTAESSGLKYRMKFFIFSYPQNAIGFNSDNIWLPLTSERRLYV